MNRLTYVIHYTGMPLLRYVNGHPMMHSLVNDPVRAELVNRAFDGDKLACNALADWYEDNGVELELNNPPIQLLI
jgi:hypothetical protein